MKKLLAMVLALVMTLSLAVSANAAFKDDKSISDDYAESVAVLNGMGVFKGYEDGSFKPEGNITRAEVATIIYRIYTADVAKNDKSGLYATYNKFSDMAGAGWAQGYIGYCANTAVHAQPWRAITAIWHFIICPVMSRKRRVHATSTAMCIITRKMRTAS